MITQEMFVFLQNEAERMAAENPGSDMNTILDSLLDEFEK